MGSSPASSDRDAHVAAQGRRKWFIVPRTATEVRVLMELLHEGKAGPYWPPPDDDAEWRRIIDVLERSIGMAAIKDAFTELLEDTDQLRDPEQEGYAGSSVAIALDRDEFSVLDIGVRLKEISGEQLAYVLDVAERHGLQVREQQGWLRLSVSDPIDPMETADEPEEALAV